MRKSTIDGVTVTTDFDCDLDEMENYVEYVDCRVNEHVTEIYVKFTCHDENPDNVKWDQRGLNSLAHQQRKAFVSS